MHTAEEAPKCIQSEQKKCAMRKTRKKARKGMQHIFFCERMHRAERAGVGDSGIGGENAGERKYKTRRRRSLRTFLSTFLAKHVLSMKFGDFLVLYFFLLPNTTTIRNPFILAKGVRRSQTIYCWLLSSCELRWIFIWDAIKVRYKALSTKAGSMLSGHVWSWTVWLTREIIVS